MENTKTNSGILALVVVAAIFAGWQATLIVSAMVLLFGNIEEGTKKVLITVLTFLAGLALFELCWGLIVGGISLVSGTITDVVNIINMYVKNPISTLKLQQYVLTPISGVVNILDNVVEYAMSFLKFLFILSIIANKKLSKNYIFDKIYSYVEKFANYVNNFGTGLVNQPQPNVVNNPVPNANNMPNMNANPNVTTVPPQNNNFPQQ